MQPTGCVGAARRFELVQMDRRPPSGSARSYGLIAAQRLTVLPRNGGPNNVGRHQSYQDDDRRKPGDKLFNERGPGLQSETPDHELSQNVVWPTFPCCRR